MLATYLDPHPFSRRQRHGDTVIALFRSPTHDIVESILAVQAFADISLRHCRKGIPVFWEEQRRVLKSTAAHDLEAVANQ